jgi:hypothetical protein
VSALLMGLCVLALYLLSRTWTPFPELVGISAFLAEPSGWPVVASLFGVATFGGMFVVPLYAFPHHQRAQVGDRADGGGQQHRQFGRDGRGDGAAVRNGPAWRVGAGDLAAGGGGTVVSAWLGRKLHQACREAVTPELGDEQADGEKPAA